MQIKIGGFPVVYTNAQCRKHGCYVEVRFIPLAVRAGDGLAGGQVIFIRCWEGGNVDVAPCTNDWVLELNGPGPAIIE